MGEFPPQHRAHPDTRGVSSPKDSPEGCPHERARAHEDALLHDPRARRAAGRFYTPPPIARHLANLLLAPPAPDLPLVDPACGAGDLLLGAVHHLLPDPTSAPLDARRKLAGRLHGIDTDRDAIAIARERLRLALDLPPADADLLPLRVADGLSETLPQPAHVLLNPPFGNAIRSETARSARTTAALRERFPVSTTGAFDRAWVFVERAHQLADNRGRIALLLPRAFAASPSAAALHDLLGRTHHLLSLEPLPPGSFRHTDVATLLAILTPRQPRHPAPEPWARHL
ncbi:MAG: hypothetical protein EA398_06975, partial [Deltaproteobacteria bacterium]